VNSPEDGPVGPKHVEIRRYTNKIEIVTSVGFLFLIFLCQLYMFRAMFSPIKRST
jgi:hypothetical protein